MDSPVYMAGLELRRRGKSRRLRGKFPYKKRAVLDAGGNGRRPKKEEFAPKAFSFAVEDPERDIHLLVGHSFDKPLASKKAGTLILTDTAEALKFEADLLPEVMETTWGKDFEASFAAGLIGGISPGFRVPPPEAVPNAEEVTEENPREGNALIRIINAAVLFELSVVTRPAYGETALELQGTAPAQGSGVVVSDDPPDDRAALWIDRAAGYVPKRWDGSAWKVARDPEAQEAAKEAEDERRWDVTPGGVITPRIPANYRWRR